MNEGNDTEHAGKRRQRKNVAPSTDRTAAKVYREAARNLSDWWTPGEKYRSPYSCDHIGNVLGLYTARSTDAARARFRDLRGRYADLFAPDTSGADFWHGWDDAANERILALCFMAAMVEAGDA